MKPTVQARPRRSLSGKRIPADVDRPANWHFLVRAAQEPKEEPSEMVDFTDTLGETFEVPRDALLNARARRRHDQRARARRVRKGTRRFYEQQRREEFRRDTVAAQLHVLETREPGDPLFDNVVRALGEQYKDELQ